MALSCSSMRPVQLWFVMLAQRMLVVVFLGAPVSTALAALTSGVHAVVLA